MGEVPLYVVQNGGVKGYPARNGGTGYRDTSLLRSPHPPQDPTGGLSCGPTVVHGGRWGVLMREVPLRQGPREEARESYLTRSRYL